MPSRQRAPHRGSDPAQWVTLREAEAATGIPSNTLRKWVRRADLPSMLESDGDVVLRMVDLAAVRARARQLGRKLVPPSGGTGESASQGGPEVTDEPTTQAAPPHSSVFVPPSGGTGESSSQGGLRDHSPAEPEPPQGTMIVPIDAWNKMLNQLGNLHEAGQQLAVVSERAAKAETEARFLRERLEEMRAERGATIPVITPEPEPEPEPAPEPDPVETTAYWRYLTTGWRDRKRRSR
ncbi:MAG: hypothetical protein QGM47_11025 [Actinomycetota bacterium]|nr:hypothetical protein [Actinomycetota bacterium]